MSDIALSTAPSRSEFVFPTNKGVNATRIADEDESCTYLCGNSLGLLPKRVEALVQEELRIWGTKAVEGHFVKGGNWVTVTDRVNPLLAELVGAREAEVACMGTLTANLHLMMNVFYKPTPGRFKILCEGKAFPSDQYAFASQAIQHGLDPKNTIIEMYPREGEFFLREEDILDVIAQQGTSIALVIFSGVQYYTGQFFPMQSITKAAKAQGCICGWDLAHAVGNVALSLHDWDVDFAVWCSYKYLNSGPGGIGGLFVHEKWDDRNLPKYGGWWGHELATRFDMPPIFSPTRGAQGFQQSNPSVLCVAALDGSLQVFKDAGMMTALRARSVRLTAYLEKKLTSSAYYIPPHEVASKYPAGAAGAKPAFTIITPSDPESRGSQLSLKFLPLNEGLMMNIYRGLKSFGVVADERKPDVIRLAPTALYNTSEDCDRAAHALEETFKTLL